MIKENIIGKKYGKLTITDIAPTPKHIKNPKTLYVYCDCDCGNKKVIKRYENLKYNLVCSCGCENHQRYKTNRYEIKENYIIMYDFKNREFYISLEDLDKVLKLTWYVREDFNTVTNAQNSISLHRYLLDVNSSNLDVDHINHNRLDNRRENLRVVNRVQNNRNKGLSKYNTSGCTGVSRARNKWEAYITMNNKKVYLGHYDNKEDAIAARKDAEEKYYGEYSYDNSMKMAEKYNIEDIN